MTYKYPEKREAWKTKERTKLKLLILTYLSDHSCIDCGEDDPIVLEFDHVRGTKIKAVSALVNDCRDWKDISIEIEKCDVRCANCHKRKTAKELGFWKQIAS